MTEPSQSNPVAVIDSVVHGSHSVLSFRELSALLSVPLHTAQAHLTSYVTDKQKDQTDVNVLWHVTNTSPAGHVRTSLTANPSESATSKKVWAIAPLNSSGTPAVWLQPDRNRDLEQVRQSTHTPNPLRDGRFLPVASSTSSWDCRPDPRFGNAPMPRTEHQSSAKQKPSSLLQSVKQSVKQPVKQPTKQPTKRAPSSKSAFKQPPSRQNGTSNSLFSSKRLGHDATARMRAKQGKPEAPAINMDKSEQNSSRELAAQRKEGKKNRRIQIIDSEDESGDDKMDISRPEDDNKQNGGDDGDADSIQEMEQRALEKERSQEEQEELERELRDLTNEGDDEEPESPTLQQMDVGEKAKKGAGGDEDEAVTSPTKSPLESTKRSFRESFGLPEETRGARRIRKEVEEVVEENGYMVTRRVVKTFDENGNEVNCEDVDSKEVGLAESNEVAMAKQTPETPVKSKSTVFKSLNPKSAQKKDNGKMEKTGSKPGPSSASKKPPKKKVKGNIMSYFGKKG